MAYTPELSMKSSCTLRRISWALGVPMTQTIERVFEHLPRILNRKMVCAACRDKSKCHECSFSTHQRKENHHEQRATGKTV
jgi:recombinational DNA repair protein RecR